MNNKELLLRRLNEAKLEYRNLSIEHWLKNELFTWVWWLNLLFIIGPLLIWWKVVDRNRILEISVFGLIVNVQSSFNDVTGSEFVLWNYPIRMLPHSVMMFPVNLIVLPIIFMLIYQYLPKWKGFIIGITTASAIIAFILEPAAVLINEYELINWRYIYSFPIYILMAVVARLITEMILRKSTCN